MEASELDIVMPLNLNVNKRCARNVLESMEVTSESQQQPLDNPSPCSKNKVLGPAQAKKRLLAFAQQWPKTKEKMEDDKALEKRPNENGTLKYTYVVEGVDGETVSFPARLIQYTLTEPHISFCPNPRYAQGVYQLRKEVLDSCSQEEKHIMYFIMNSSSPSCQDKGFPGRYRKWYVSRRSFIGLPEEDEEGRYSPHWESESENELDPYPPLPSKEPPTPRPLKSDQSLHVISKVKINQVELPFFEDDDFLETLMVKAGLKIETDPVSKQVQSTSEPSFAKEGASLSTPSTCDDGWEPECKDPEGSMGRRNTPDWETERRPLSSSCRESRSTSRREGGERDSKRRRQRSPSPHSPLSCLQRDSSDLRKHGYERPVLWKGERDSLSPRKEPRTPPYDEERGYGSPRKEDGGLQSSVNMDDSFLLSREHLSLNLFLDDGSTESDRDVSESSNSKRLSLDQRLELELGIKIENESQQSVVGDATTQASPLQRDTRSSDCSPVKRRPGFGPKAVLSDALIAYCPKALPAQPFIPLHLQSRLCRPLTRALPAASVSTSKQDEEETKGEKRKSPKDGANQAVDVDSPLVRKKNWDKELRHLEALASNLETADESVWQELEEKLLLFEVNNIFAPSRSESPLQDQDTGETGNDPSKLCGIQPNRERSPPHPIELKEPGKGILVMPRVSLLLDGPGAGQKKAVVFADSVRPGCGSSSEDEEVLPPVRSPPPVIPAAAPVEKPMKKIVRRRKKPDFDGPDHDPVYDVMPPPPPPPGSPPPHLPQGRSSPPPLMAADAPPSSILMPESPLVVESC